MNNKNDLKDDWENQTISKLTEIVEYHIELHGKNIVKGAILDDAVRKFYGYDNNRAVLSVVFDIVLENINEKNK